MPPYFYPLTITFLTHHPLISITPLQTLQIMPPKSSKGTSKPTGTRKSFRMATVLSHAFKVFVEIDLIKGL